MKTNLLLDVAELSLRSLPDNSAVTFVNIEELYERFLRGESLCKSKASFDEFRLAIKTVFPIYKNNRRKTKIFKISSVSAYRYFDSKSIKFRPLSHIKAG
ncbi:hypothetical protein ACH5Y9_01215 [Methylomonas sp. BW4-1]|uniref:hypothetical protein n=1 Tax=Methylomonas sp. BW4-1 TaxID=3376685 RepID=UPI0040432A79